jgi:hypothetical protein
MARPLEEPESGGDALKFFKMFLQRTCTHRFSWPRIDHNGRHYQICLACGTAFEYDWGLMRRTGRVLTESTTAGVATLH